VSNGAADDLNKVHQLAYAIVVTYGMSKKYENFSPLRSDGHNIYSETTAAEIDKEIMELIGSCTEHTRGLLRQHMDKIKGLA
jgi:cell division protease FtsH